MFAHSTNAKHPYAISAATRFFFEGHEKVAYAKTNLTAALEQIKNLVEKQLSQVIVETIDAGGRSMFRLVDTIDVHLVIWLR